MTRTTPLFFGLVLLLGFCLCEWEDDWDSFELEDDTDEGGEVEGEVDEEGHEPDVEEYLKNLPSNPISVADDLPSIESFDPANWVFDEVVEPSEELFVDTTYRLVTDIEIQPIDTHNTILSLWKDPVFVIWVKPLTNASLEHNWIDDVLLARVARPIVKVFPEV